MVRTVRRTMIRFLIELLVRRTWFGQFDELYFVLSCLVMRCKLRPELAADVHLPPNSARFSYATEGALFNSAQLSIKRRGQRPPKGLGTNNYDCRSNLAPKHAREHETHPPRVKKRVPSRFKRLCRVLFVLV